jgi:hypothetical protein
MWLNVNEFTKLKEMPQEILKNLRHIWLLEASVRNMG